MTADPAFNGNIDRNLGSYIHSTVFNSLRNTYNISIYGSVYNNTILNFGYVVHLPSSNAVLTSYDFWGACGITNKAMINQDYLLFYTNGSIGDGFSASRTSSAVKLDNASGCVSNSNGISAGRGQTSISAAYTYWHASRPLSITDNCDTNLNVGDALCYAWLDGASGLANFASKHEGWTCAGKLESSTLSSSSSSSPSSSSSS